MTSSCISQSTRQIAPPIWAKHMPLPDVKRDKVVKNADSNAYSDAYIATGAWHETTHP
jgi:uncharacterized cupin superfamily protein